MQTHVRITESSHLVGLYVGALLEMYLPSPVLKQKILWRRPSFIFFPGRLPYPNAGETELGGPRASPVGNQVGSKFVFLVLFINITTAVKTHFENPGILTHRYSFYSVPLQSLSFCGKK